MFSLSDVLQAAAASLVNELEEYITESFVSFGFHSLCGCTITLQLRICTVIVISRAHILPCTSSFSLVFQVLKNFIVKFAALVSFVSVQQTLHIVYSIV